ncbi:hypothetical protein [Desulfogranum marinum]|uniref:hypothetical protein n=1 Tax=Desulfogranum marinum TaxID=453220 RepID=UPI0019629B73|nr:hypothetical protein [Desulfogranum marinum]MBM9513964.1 hypothetical protein [Desulfogranum marinum]
MKRLTRIMIPMSLVAAMCTIDIPMLPVELVPDAQAIFGVRRRTAVVAYSAGRATSAAAASAFQQQAAAAQQQAAYSQQQAAAAQQEAETAKQQAATAQQQAASPQPASGVPLGTVLETLPEEGCLPITVGNTQYQKCNDSFYRAAFMGNKLVYIAVEKPF